MPDATTTTTTPAQSLHHGLTAEEVRALTEKSLDARGRAYCPYSSFRVGCALLLHPSSSNPQTPPTTTPTIIQGANVENAAYPVGTCAERVAVGTAVVQAGLRRGGVKAVGVATDIQGFASPCGMCRQFLREFLDLDTPIFMHNRDGEYEVRSLGELLPMSFGPDTLPPAREMERMRGEGGKA
ncbi:uncharacterized protein K452DRAFT_282664 [Aplosporella prunicola CBS 121167]|uniref:Cytidine deaminase n=1 Tax=Aplosporella prunicola CBS 121167 TaxID=1176127 RepID=A0A6A6BQV5_9PEZI|nr:uncharacterized protein K452DRAFT_282664 [Aplosporella prunicola CBS 121167]KAF2146489.1 hypothetical protein K452DRAFT_282664 [Aplosporella prunicola CBS 121167]